MRLSQTAKKNLKKDILSTLYTSAQDALHTRRRDVAIQNRDYYLEPLAAALVVMPEALLTHHKEYHVSINYTQPAHVGEAKLKEVWICSVAAPVVNPVEKSTGMTYNISTPTKNALDPRLYAVAAELAEDILALQKERNDLDEFLGQTLGRYSGTIQLKKAWPDSLHKFLPTEPPKKPKKSKKSESEHEDVADAVVPAALNIRLTTNLLEGK